MLNQLDDFRLLGGGVSYSSSLPSTTMLFEQAAFQREISHQDIHVPHLTMKVHDLAAGRHLGCVPRQALLPGHQELYRPAVVQALGNALLLAQLGDALLAAEPLQYDPDPLLGRMVLSGRPADVLHNSIGRRPYLGFRCRRLLVLSHLCLS